MAATIAVLSQKGGTGKTTAVRSLADVLRRIGLTVLVVDLDPQGNLSDYYDVPPDAAPTVAEVLTGESSPGAAVHGEGIVPANLRLAEAELQLTGKMGRELKLRKALRELRRGRDVILIDCPPSLGLLTSNGLVAADYALISSEAQYFAMQGVEQALELLELVRELNPDLELLGILLNIADLRTKHSREALESLREHFGDAVFDTVIRSSIAYAESAERALSILDHRPDLGQDYVDLAAEVLRRLDLEEHVPRLGELSATVS